MRSQTQQNQKIKYNVSNELHQIDVVKNEGNKIIIKLVGLQGIGEPTLAHKAAVIICNSQKQLRNLYFLQGRFIA